MAHTVDLSIKLNSQIDADTLKTTLVHMGCFLNQETSNSCNAGPQKQKANTWNAHIMHNNYKGIIHQWMQMSVV